jgi:hypothetical protein
MEQKKIKQFLEEYLSPKSMSFDEVNKIVKFSIDGYLTGNMINILNQKGTIHLIYRSSKV